MQQELLFEHSDIRILISLVYFFLTFLIALASVVDLNYGFSNISLFLSKIFNYGKTTPDDVNCFDFLQVPKRLFAHFYVIGTVVASVVLIAASETFEIHPTTQISLAMIILHTFRRLYESYFLTVFSNSKMSIAHYALGIFFYFTMPLCIFWSDEHAASRGPFSTLVFLILSMVTQTVQHLSSRQLAALRNPKSKAARRNSITVAQYSVPRGSMFTFVTCPHFTAEIALYGLTHAFLLGLPTSFISPFFACLLFVWTNQFCAARIQYRWYQQHFPQFTKSRTSLLPCLI